KRRRSSMTELAFHGIHTSRRTKAESVTHVSGTFCHLCLGPLKQNQLLRLVDWLQRTIERTISARYREPDIESICRTLAAQTDDPVERAALLEIAGNYRKAPPC
ncbi:hypothetical protein, partial [Bradyrhizobium canariense]